MRIRGIQIALIVAGSAALVAGYASAEEGAAPQNAGAGRHV